MATTIQRGVATTTGTTATVTVTSYTASKTWLRFSVRCPGTDNAWDCQMVGKKVNSTTIEFTRRGNTGTAVVSWELIEDDDFSVQDLTDVGPLASTTFEDYTITAVTQSRTFVDFSARQTGDRDENSWARARLTSGTNVRIETGASVTADFDWFAQIVSISASRSPRVQMVVLDTVSADSDTSITSVKPDRTFTVQSAFKAFAGEWTNAFMHSVRLKSDGTQVQMRRVSQSSGSVSAVIYVIECKTFRVQRATNTGLIGTVGGATQSFTAPSEPAKCFLPGGSYYCSSAYMTNGGDINDSNVTLRSDDGTFSTINLVRSETVGDVTVEVQMVEVIDPDINIKTAAIVQGSVGSPPSLVVSALDTKKIAIVMLDEESSAQASAVTLGGVAMTKVLDATAVEGANNAQSMWALLDKDFPAGAGPHAVAVTGSGVGAACTVFYLRNAQQVIPSGAAVDTTVSVTPELSITSTATAPSGNSLAVGGAGHGDETGQDWNATPTGTGTWSRLFDNDPVSAFYVGGWQKFTSSGSKNYTESVASNTWNRATSLLAIFAEAKNPITATSTRRRTDRSANLRR